MAFWLGVLARRFGGAFEWKEGAGNYHALPEIGTIAEYISTLKICCLVMNRRMDNWIPLCIRVVKVWYLVEWPKIIAHCTEIISINIHTGSRYSGLTSNVQCYDWYTFAQPYRGSSTIPDCSSHTLQEITLLDTASPFPPHATPQFPSRQLSR